MKYTAVIIVQLILVLSLGCAKQTSPTGGPKDTIPPGLIESFPKNKTVNFRSKSIQLIFDEAVIVNNPREQLIITPTIGKDVQMTARKKTIILELNDELEDSTTYTINFRESVQDITEKNPARNLQLAFSTGTYIDSLFVKGSVYEILTGKEVKDATVALYLNSDTFNIFKHKPPYLTKTDEKGNFLIENLKPGKYNIYAFADKNKNIIVDSRSERYGFLADPIDLQPGVTTQIKIPILPLDSRELKLISARPNNTYFNIRASKLLRNYLIKTPEYPDSLIYHSYGEDHSNIKVFLPFLQQDSISLHFTAFDTIGFKLDTILYAKLSTRKATPEKLQSSLTKPPTVITSKNQFRAQIKVSKPIVSFTYDSITYQVDSLNIISFSEKDIEYDNHTGLITFTKSLPKEHFPNEEGSGKPDIKTISQSQSKSKYNKFFLGKGAFISADLDSSNRSSDNVVILNSQNTGTLLVQVNTAEPTYILQLLSRDLKVISESHNNNSVVFDNVPPGDYFLRLVVDRNSNQTWDAGNFFNKTEPEPIVFYRNEDNNSTISLKANWELGPLLINYPQNVDNL